MTYISNYKPQVYAEFITYAFLKFTGGSDKPQLKSGHGLVIISYIFIWI